MTASEENAIAEAESWLQLAMVISTFLIVRILVTNNVLHGSNGRLACPAERRAYSGNRL
jgi:hypothetical protein